MAQSVPGRRVSFASEAIRLSDLTISHLTKVHAERVRIESVDLVRGIIMMVMALDHTRDFFGVPGDSPTDLLEGKRSPVLQARWITNICAPVFFLLPGTGSSLSLRRRSRSELSRFLFTRGLWLIFLEGVRLRCLVVQFNFDDRITSLVVVWALGWAVITLSVLIYLPTSVIAAFGLILIAVHNLFDPIQAASFGAFAPLWNILHVPDLLIDHPHHQVILVYPLIPWILVTAVGFALAADLQLAGRAPPRIVSPPRHRNLDRVSSSCARSIIYGDRVR